MVRETAIQNRVRDALRRQGAFVVKYHASGYGTDGIPDLLACYRGAFMGLEVKAGGNQPTRLQEVRIGQIAEAGGLSLPVWSPTEALGLVELVDRRLDALGIESLWNTT